MRPRIAVVVYPGCGDIRMAGPFLHLSYIGLVIEHIGRGRRAQCITFAAVAAVFRKAVIEAGFVARPVGQFMRYGCRLARRYTMDPELLRAETVARQSGRGLWSDSQPIPPWEFRRQRGQQKGERKNTEREPAAVH